LPMAEEDNFSEQPEREGDQEKKRGYKFLWPKLNTPEWVSAIATVAAVVVALASVVVAYQTRVVMDRQLGEMQSSGADTKNLITATQQLAKAAGDQAKATGDLKAVTQAQADKIAGLYGAIQASAASSDKAAKATLAQSQATQAESRSVAGQTTAVQQSLAATRDMASATRESAKAGQRGNEIANAANIAANRPWVGVSEVQKATPIEGQEYKIGINIRNTGHSPALNTRARFIAGLAVPGTPYPKMPECDASCSSATLLPNGEVGYWPTWPKEQITKDEIERVKSLKDVLYIYARIDYLDPSGQKHVTIYCAWYDARIDDISTCPTDNSAN
jgi:hypothetical protein